MAKYLDETGVGTLWNKIKSVFATKTEVKNDHYTKLEVDRIQEGNVNALNNKLGKTETAVKANGVVDIHDGRELKFRYAKEGTQVSGWYPMWEGNTLTCVQRELVKDDLGIYKKTNSIPVGQFPNRPSGSGEYGFAFCNNPNIAPNQDDYLLFVDSYQSAYFGVCLNAESQITWHKLVTENDIPYKPMNGGLIPQESSSSWGVQTGQEIASWADNTAGGLKIRRNCPIDGQMSLVIDGTVYVNEGNNAVYHDGNLIFSLSGSTLTITKR